MIRMTFYHCISWIIHLVTIGKGMMVTMAMMTMTMTMMTSKAE